MTQPTDGNQVSRRWPWNMTGGLMIGLILGLILGLIEGNLLEDIGFGFIIGLALGALFERRGQLMQYPPGMMRRIGLAGGLFLITLIGSLDFIDSLGDRTLQIAIACAPVVAFALLVLAIGSALASLDELQRRIQTESIAIGFGFTAIVVVGVDLLADVGLSQPGWIYVVVPMVTGWGIGKLWTMWKYR